MNLIKDIWIRQERAETGFGTEIDRAAAILKPREVGGVGVAEDPSAQGDEEMTFFAGSGWHVGHRRVENPPYATISAMKTSKGLMVNPNGGFAVFRRSALENRIWSWWPFISWVREKSRFSLLSE